MNYNEIFKAASSGIACEIDEKLKKYYGIG